VRALLIGEPLWCRVHLDVRQPVDAGVVRRVTYDQVRRPATDRHGEGRSRVGTLKVFDVDVHVGAVRAERFGRCASHVDVKEERRPEQLVSNKPGMCTA
jgi:hypothetical protein